ncbi:MAG: hypothetical protein MUC79_16280 [Thiobacillaceae bacterium]|jgi:hypothetical protein|nr:hypothetical protein [Thiobacillaceae bacterium]
MSIQTYRPTLNAGQVYLRVAGSAAPLVAIGNVSALQLEIAEEEKTLQDYTRPGGGQWAAVSRVTGVTASMTLHDLDPVNLSRALYGDTDAETGATVTAETHTAYQRGLVRLAHPAPTSVTVKSGDVQADLDTGTEVADNAITWTAVPKGTLGNTVTVTIVDPAGNNAALAVSVAGSDITVSCATDGSSAISSTAAQVMAAIEASAAASALVTVADTGTSDGSGLVVAVTETALSGGTDTTHVVDVDYEVRPEGIMILEAGIADATEIRVGYTYAAYDVVEALTAGSQTYELSFGGLNEANSNSPVVLDIYRLQIGAAANLSLIGDDFAALEVSGKVLLDSTKTGTGISRYFKVSMAA